jgi:hypothetical protein
MDELKQYFIKGILYFFGLEKNPAESFLEETRKKTDAERMAEDWQKIGNDIRKIYDYGKS